MIQGNLVKFTYIKRDYIDVFLKWMNDPEITQYLIFYKPMTREMEEAWYSSLHKQENLIIFSILAKKGKILIGNCSIEINWKNRVGKCGILIGEKDYLGKGYGTEAMHLLINYGFNTLNLNRIELEVYDFNIRAIKSYQKVGFKEEGHRRQANYANGEYHDIIIMGILRSEWNPLKS